MMVAIRGMLLLGVGMAMGCVAPRQPTVTGRAATPMPAAQKAYYDHSLTSIAAYDRQQLYRGSSHSVYRIELPLQLPSELAVRAPDKRHRDIRRYRQEAPKLAADLELDFVNRIDYYLPRGSIPASERRPAILISPILGGNMVVDGFARYYARQGYAAAIVHRRAVLWDTDMGEQWCENYLRANVIRLRHALDWLSQQPDVDPERIGALGISYGAIMHALLAATDSRVRFHILAMPAGELPALIMECPERSIGRFRRDVMLAYDWERSQLASSLAATVKTDPLKLAPHVDSRQMLYYHALFDRVVGSSRTEALWGAMGQPRRRIIPAGHYGGLLLLPILHRQTFTAFANAL